MMHFHEAKNSEISNSRGTWRGALVALAFLCAAAPAPSARAGAAFQISPVLLEVPAGGAVSSVNINNQDAKPASVQIRLFRWSQADGEETLTPTEDVVASPPIATIEPRGSLNVRVIRVAKSEVSAEESYRLVVDQLPGAESAGKSVVAILVRQVLPVFFEPAERGAPEVAWTVVRTDRGYALRAQNTGGRRLRIAKLTLSGSGAPIAMGGGLLGYALANGQMSWTLPARRVSFKPGARVTLHADSDVGALNATALVSAGD
jgi:fimbrial chaperone protein